MSGVRVLVGTRKGAFILTSDGKRERWDVSGPHFGGWEIYHLKGSPVDPNRLYASQWSGWFGQLIQRSNDGGKTWEPVGNKFVYDGVPGTHQWYDGTPHPWEFARVWHLEPSLDRSGHGLRRRRRTPRSSARPTAARRGTSCPACASTAPASRWQPGAGGLCLHTILLDPTHPGSDVHRHLRRRRLPHRRRRADRGSRSTAACVSKDIPEAGRRGRPLRPPHRACTARARTCSSCRSTGTSCAATTRATRGREVSGNLPTDFGFVDRRPRARAGDDLRRADQERLGALSARRPAPRLPQPHRRQRVGGARRTGCRERDCYVNVLRDAMAVDALDSCGVYFGTTGGQVYVSADAGDHWSADRPRPAGRAVGRGADARLRPSVIRVELPAHLRTLARVGTRGAGRGRRPGDAAVDPRRARGARIRCCAARFATTRTERAPAAPAVLRVRRGSVARAARCAAARRGRRAAPSRSSSWARWRADSLGRSAALGLAGGVYRLNQYRVVQVFRPAAACQRQD